MKRVAVIGGGASGMIAACFAGVKGCSVVLFEKQKKLGRKILVTGNGRCNISNRCIDVSRYHGSDPDFVSGVFAGFGPEDTEEFFLSLGIPFRDGKDGKVFPASLQASSVLSALEYEMARRGVDVRLHRRIDRIIPKGSQFRLVTAGSEEHLFDSVILSAGSCAYSPVGASKIGYTLAESLRHRIVPCFPGILPLNITEKTFHRLQGVKWDCAVTVMHEGAAVARSTGEMLFTGYGISGPAALEVSRAVNSLVIKGIIPIIEIDFFPEQSGDGVRALLASLWQQKEKPLALSMSGLINEKLSRLFCECAGLQPDTPAGRAGESEKETIAANMKGLRLTPGAPRDFAEAVIAAGGVDTRDIDPATMESTIIKNLHVTGELLDIDGDSGGFNLQFAWSTGALAGRAQ